MPSCWGSCDKMSRMRTWDQLSENEQQVMLLAGEEGMLWEVCATLEPDPARRAQVVADAAAIAGTLARDGLLWFYRLSEGNPPLSEVAAVALFATPADWLRDSVAGTVADICLYPTADGERLLGVAE